MSWRLRNQHGAEEAFRQLKHVGGRVCFVALVSVSQEQGGSPDGPLKEDSGFADQHFGLGVDGQELAKSPTR
jgi:hypothetical protein